MERTILCLHILKQIITHTGFAAEVIFGSLVDGKFENMWKAYQKVRMYWIILVTAFCLVEPPIEAAHENEGYTNPGQGHGRYIC